MSFNPPPTPKDKESVVSWANTFTQWIFKALKDKVDRDEKRNSILLVSPDGSVYTVAVDNAGAIVTTKVGET